MSYTKAEIRELARLQLARLTRRELGKIEIDAICTIALDFYARETYAFEQESAFNTAVGTTTYSIPTNASGFLAPINKHAFRVGTDYLAKSLIVNEQAFEDLQDKSPGSSRHFWMIDDAAGVFETYPEPTAIEAVRFRNYYVPSLPTAEATDYPEPLELAGFMQCVRAALWDLLDEPDKAERLRVIFRSNYLADIKKRLKERRMPGVHSTRFRSTG